jgi:hypothetical protein
MRDCVPDRHGFDPMLIARILPAVSLVIWRNGRIRPNVLLSGNGPLDTFAAVLDQA